MSQGIELPNLTLEQEQAVAAKYLAELAATEPDLLPFDIFVPVAKLVVTHTVEVGFIKPSDEDPSGAQVLLTQRPADDKFWANLWHLPGSVVRGTDPVKHLHDYDAAISRTIEEVGGSIEIIDEPVTYDVVRRKGTRGSEATVRLMAVVAGIPDEGRFFGMTDVQQRPPEHGLIVGHADEIQRMADLYTSIRAAD